MTRGDSFAAPDLQALGRQAVVSEFGWNAAADTFYLIINDKKGWPAVNTPVGPMVWVRHDPDSGEVFGFEIEDWTSVVKRDPIVQALWSSIRATAPHRRSIRFVDTQAQTAEARQLVDYLVPKAA